MESRNVIKVKKVISYITLGVYIIFMFLASILMLALLIGYSFDISDYIIAEDGSIIWSEIMGTILFDTVFLYGIPLITCAVQFFTNRIYFIIQLGIVSVHWLFANSIILAIGISEIANH